MQKVEQCVLTVQKPKQSSTLLSFKLKDKLKFKRIFMPHLQFRDYEYQHLSKFNHMSKTESTQAYLIH